MTTDPPSRSGRAARWLLRWTLRLLVLAGLGWVLFLPWPREVVGRCRVVPISQHGLRASQAGEVLEVLVREGDLVELGQLIALLDDRDHRTALRTAEAELARHTAELDLLLAGPRQEELEIARANQELWELRLEHYEEELRRVEELAEKNAGSTKDVEEARLARDEAIHRLASARESLALLEAPPREEQVRAQRALIESARAAIDHHTQAIDAARMESPIAGRIVTPFLEERVGNVIGAGELLAVIQDTTQLAIEVAADESAAALAEPGLPVEIRLDALDGEPIDGAVQRLGLTTASEAEFEVDPIRSDRESQLQRSSGSKDLTLVRVVCSLDAPDPRLVPGMTGYARIRVDESVLWLEIWRPIERFFRTDVWSWLP